MANTPRPDARARPTAKLLLVADQPADLLTLRALPQVLRAKVAAFVELFEEVARARHEAEQFRLLIEGTKEYAIFMLDPQGHIRTWNAGAQRIKGYRAEEIIGQHFSRFYPAEDVK